MPKVTALEPQRRRGRYNLYLDGTFALGLSERVVAEAGLWVGRELSPEEVEALEALERRARALEDGLRLLAHRPRSRAELEARLRRKGHPAEAIDHALRRLTELGYVEDGAFARAWVEDVEAFIAKLREEYRITDGTLLAVGLIIMTVVIFFFVTHGIFHMEVSVAALFGASLLFTYALVTKKVDLLEVVEKDIEWTTLLFFMFLFILVGSVEETGLLDMVADGVYRLSQGSLTVATCLILWVAAIMSAFVDNIPFTATMLPITAYLSRVIPGAETHVLWWALALGACFGGNGTMIGASANVVTLGIAEAAGHRIKFFEYMKVGFIYMLISVAIANVWLLIFY